jgi:hypothetical protein
MKSEANVPYPSLIPMLAELERLLAKHGWRWQASHVHTLIELQDTNEGEFVRLLQDGGMWGGSGSVLDIGNVGDDTARFNECLVELAEEMERIVLDCEGSRFAAYALRRWKESGA